MERAQLTGKEVPAFNEAIRPIATEIHLVEAHGKGGVEDATSRPIRQDNDNTEGQ